MNYERKRILVKSEPINFFELDNKNLSEIIEYFNDLRESYNSEFSTNEPVLSVKYYGYDGAHDDNLNVYEDEPDEDYEVRVRELESIRKNIEVRKRAKERKVYEELKKKFDGV